jgi:predicted site-specific integrase-resolvase
VSVPLISTGQAAKALGITRTTLGDWWRAGLVEPSEVTAGGHGRWNLDKLRADLRRVREAAAEQAEAKRDAAHAVEHGEGQAAK